MKIATLKATIKDLPPEFDLDELLDRLVFMDKVEKGLAELKAGKGIPQTKVIASFKRKWRK